ncbi:protein LLP homolog isoform X2 [Centruroides vittatus]|uniref:protein LLP homolog isoform X2 n=1 Tax=Centruroides vittatus TaxID=120091 RepID=UPI00350F7BB0
MAKSLRSKWKRKMKKIKRERYAQKELVALKKVLSLQETRDTLMKDIDSVAVPMEDDSKRKYSSKTKRDEYGTYPVWMNQRAIRKLKGKKKAGKKAKK